MLNLSKNLRERIPGGSLKGATEFLEKLHWFLYIKESGGRTLLYQGETWTFDADSMDAVEAFVYGALMAYLSLPKPLFEQFQDEFKRHEEKCGPFKRPSLPGLTPL